MAMEAECMLCGKPRAGDRDDSENDSDDDSYLFQEELESVNIDNKCASSTSK